MTGREWLLSAFKMSLKLIIFCSGPMSYVVWQGQNECNITLFYENQARPAGNKCIKRWTVMGWIKYTKLFFLIQHLHGQIILVLCFLPSESLPVVDVECGFWNKQYGIS